MTREENALIQALRLEIQTAFKGVQDSIVELTAEQRAHLASHEERDKARKYTAEKEKETAITRRWVVQVVVSTVGIAVALTSLIFGIATKMLNV